MSLGELRLAIGSETLIIDEFRTGADGYDRMPDPELQSKVAYSANRTPAVDGMAGEAPFVWTIGAYLDETQYRTLQRIVAEQNYLRYTPPRTGFEVLVWDECRIYQERGTVRTRGAIGTVESVGNCLEYYAQFYAWIANLKATEDGELYNVSFLLKELGRVAP